ncbi:atrophin-1-like [Pyrus ussuriensis x Pyrus communis]|uniref:Atrophin-1-like n=1 Tax=Pyrus ussuriensis x Pyrus communis TaxID=2448454 RepID=A0A5N5FT17_9ROSA|nr:atrophin-1-like [Pyrus ussuriensis x Pyrus communis]
MVAMVAAKKKLVFPLKRDATIAPLSAKPTSMATSAALTVPSKRPCPERIKKKANKREQEIHVISSQTTGATTPSGHLFSHVVQASTRVPPNPPLDQTTKVRPTTRVMV